MVDINGYEISKAFTGGEPVSAIYSFGVKVWPTVPEPVDYSKQYFRISAGEIYTAKITLKMSSVESNYKLYYRRDGKGDWTKITSLETTLKILVNSYIEFKGVNDKLYNSNKDYFSIISNDSIYERTHIVSGNIMSLLYGDDFIDKNELKSEYTFCRLFYYNNTLYDASNLILPANKLTRACYSYMFYNCTSLEQAPVLPATELASYCYNDMFGDCTSLTNLPELPSTKLADHCYSHMFEGCDSLVDASNLILPATELASNCYNNMFYRCTKLTTAPELQATTLASYCYYEMFYGCTSLTTAPELPATTLIYYCYKYMFYGCSKLNYVKANFTTEPSNDYTENWLSGVASTGTFVANPSATWPSSITRGPSTVPAGWTIQK